MLYFNKPSVLILLLNRCLTEYKNGFLCVHLLFCASNVRITHNHQCCAADGLVASRDNNNNVSPCLQEADSQGGEAQMPRLPEVRHDIFSMVGCATEMSVNHVSRWLPNPCFFSNWCA